MNTVIGLVGNPNCGKTVLFNALTGQRQTVGNWPGVTVEKKTGGFQQGETRITVVDLPGVYSLGAARHASEDERVARDYALSGEAAVFVNIVDAANLERNLYLTCQLLEMGVPVVVALNMMDAARERGFAIDAEALAGRLGCPVVPIVATRREGIPALKETIARAVAAPQPSLVRAPFPEPVEQSIAVLLRYLTAPGAPDLGPVDPRWWAVKTLEGESRLSLPAADLPGLLADIEERCGEEADIIIADARFRFVAAVVTQVMRQTTTLSQTLTDRIDKVVLNRALGIPIFLLMMYLMFLVTINLGGAFIDFFDKAAVALVVDLPAEILAAIGAPEWLVVLLAKGIGGGIQTVATFVPVIGLLFLFLSILEDSGYMARAAFVIDRAMRLIGLPGKAFVPLLVGFGCNVPAISATRTLEHKRDRILTVMMAPFMSCGARLPVYALFAAAFFAEGGQNVVFALYLCGLLFAVGTGLLLKNTVLRGEAASFVMELPPYHLPMPGTVLRRAWDRLRDFVLRAGQIIVPMVVILSFFNAIGTDGKFGKEDTQDSMLAAGGRLIMPVFAPMGLQEENWPAAVGLFTGIFAKEAVVGTLNALYAEAARQDAAAAGEADAAAATAETAGLGDKLLAAVATIPQNLAKLADALGDPLGIDVSYVADRGEALAELKVEDAAFGAMASRFDGTSGAFAYMLLILLYTPCVAATGAMYREVGSRWTAFAIGWTTGLGYSASVVYYQVVTFADHPVTASAWIVACLTAVGATATVLWWRGHGVATLAEPARQRVS